MGRGIERQQPGFASGRRPRRRVVDAVVEDLAPVPVAPASFESEQVEQQQHVILVRRHERTQAHPLPARDRARGGDHGLERAGAARGIGGRDRGQRQVGRFGRQHAERDRPAGVVGHQHARAGGLEPRRKVGIEQLAVLGQHRLERGIRERGARLDLGDREFARLARERIEPGERIRRRQHAVAEPGAAREPVQPSVVGDQDVDDARVQRAEEPEVRAVGFVARRHEARLEVALRRQRQFRDLEQRLEAPQRHAAAHDVGVGRRLVPALLLDAERELQCGGAARDRGQRLRVMLGARREAEIRIEQQAQSLVGEDRRLDFRVLDQFRSPATACRTESAATAAVSLRSTLGPRRQAR